VKKQSHPLTIRPATSADVPIILELIRALATYERAPNEVTATEEQLVDVLFGERADGGSASRV
jgi:N-acetylglutamate synthase-like GNAT family acetyltransferase